MDHPEFGVPGERRWTIRYGNYPVHAVTIYLFSCVSFAYFGARLREPAVARQNGKAGRHPGGAVGRR